jgi:rod shape-determining protein MreC
MIGADELISAPNYLLSEIKSVLQAYRENEYYKLKNQELTCKLREYKQTVLNNNRLLQYLNIKSSKNIKSVFARVISREPVQYYECLVIDKGKKDGFYNGLSVTAPQKDGSLVVIGSIVETYENSSKILLITSSSASLIVKVDNGNIEYLSKGNSTQFLEICYVENDTLLKLGDKMVSGYSSTIFQENVAVGVISPHSLKENPKNVYVKVFFSDEIIREVIVFVPQK